MGVEQFSVEVGIYLHSQSSIVWNSILTIATRLKTSWVVLSLFRAVYSNQCCLCPIVHFFNKSCIDLIDSVNNKLLTSFILNLFGTDTTCL